MSIGLAISRIALWSGAIDTLSSEVDSMQIDINALAATGDKADKGVLHEKRTQLTAKQFQLGLAKDFLNFWKEELKAIKDLLKSFNELAQASR